MPSCLRLWLCGLLLATACNACDETASVVQHDYVERHQEEFVFMIPRDQLLAALSDLLADKGLSLVDAPPTATTLHTTRARRNGYDEEYAIHLLPLRSGGMMVQLVSIGRDDQGKIFSSQRDPDFEWDLIQRAEPDRALAIMRTANGRADHVAPRARRLP